MSWMNRSRNLLALDVILVCGHLPSGSMFRCLATLRLRLNFFEMTNIDLNSYDDLNPSILRAVLEKLCQDDMEVRAKAALIVDELLNAVDFQQIAEDVFYCLHDIEVDDLWSRSGATRYGYTSPEEMAVQMLEEELQPYQDEIAKLMRLKQGAAAAEYCKGVLLGIYRYEKGAKSEFKDWSEDLPRECFQFQLKTWRGLESESGRHVQMAAFLEKNCNDWSEAAQASVGF
ncbi:MAG: hypothetical protein L3J39_16805 [Verrucomicrobiales bacterium]|nr:hypothetical protein [Verrucomicrobiales bacterium]